MWYATFMDHLWQTCFDPRPGVSPQETFPSSHLESEWQSLCLRGHRKVVFFLKILCLSHTLFKIIYHHYPCVCGACIWCCARVYVYDCACRGHRKVSHVLLEHSAFTHWVIMLVPLKLLENFSLSETVALNSWDWGFGSLATKGLVHTGQ